MLSIIILIESNNTNTLPHSPTESDVSPARANDRMTCPPGMDPSWCELREGEPVSYWGPAWWAPGAPMG